MKQLTLRDALLAHSVPSLGTEASIVRVKLIKDVEALDYAEEMERTLNGRSAVLAEIAHRRTVLREKASGVSGQEPIGDCLLATGDCKGGAA